MRFFLALLFLILFPTAFLFSQVTPTTEIAGDTIEGSSTDTSIVYIIKKPPVTIKEKVEVQRAKKKRYFYLSLGFSPFVNTNTYKPRTGKEEYVKHLNALTRAKPGYSFIFQLYHVPKKYIIGVAVEGRRMVEEFRYIPTNGAETAMENSYTYGGFSFVFGKWYRKNERLSYQVMAYPTLDYKYAVSGYTLEGDNINSNYIAETVAYKKINLSLFFQYKLLYRTKNSFIEIGPYAIFSPFSMTSKKEDFSITRNILGVYLSLTNKLF